MNLYIYETKVCQIVHRGQELLAGELEATRFFAPSSQSEYPVLIKGLLVVQDFCFWVVWAARPVHEIVGGQL